MITMRTSSFSCPWDSGQVGWIYCSKNKVIEEYGDFSAESIAKCEEQLRQEVKTYDEYLTGQVYGFVVKDKDGEHLDSCWGFYGLDYCKEEATDAAKYHAAKKERERLMDESCVCFDA